MSTRDRIKPPERSRRYSEGENRHVKRDEGRREKITNRTAQNKDCQREDLGIENDTTLRDTRNKGRSKAGGKMREEKRNREERRPSGVASKEGGETVERRGSRTDRFRNERVEYVPSHSGGDCAGRRSEEKLDEGSRTGAVWDEGPREWRGRGRQKNIRGGGEGYAEWGEDELSSRLDVPQIQIDPQEVPRKGFFYEHDNREVPLSSERHHQMMTRRRRFFERTPSPRRAPYWREREDHDFGRDRERRYHSRRRNSDKPYHRRGSEGEGGGGRSRGEGDRRNREESRMEHGNRRSGDVGRTRGVGKGGGREDGERDGWREERQQGRSPVRWRHDKFEVDEPAADQHGDKEEQRKLWDSGINKTWGHDKYEELVRMETEATS